MSCQITHFPTLTSVAVRSNELKQGNGRKVLRVRFGKWYLLISYIYPRALKVCEHLYASEHLYVTELASKV